MGVGLREIRFDRIESETRQIFECLTNISQCRRGFDQQRTQIDQFLLIKFFLFGQENSPSIVVNRRSTTEKREKENERDDSVGSISRGEQTEMDWRETDDGRPDDRSCDRFHLISDRGTD